MKTAKSMKFKALIFLSLSIFSIPIFSQTKISPYLFGQNAWAPGPIFKVQDQIKAVHYQAIRIGGNGYENENFIFKDAIKLIDFARSVGAEPILQMPRQLKDNNKAYQAIAYINGEMHRNIKFWSIGNEPDHHNQLASVEEVNDFFKKISAQIKSYDPEAKIIGFDLSSYKASYLDRLLGGDLDVSGKIPGKDYYYLDVVSFHGYKFPDITKFEGEVNQLESVLNRLNISRPKNQQLTWAITEFNSHWLVDPSLGNDYMPFNFHNGQMYAQVYDLGMRKGAFTICPWSMLEGGAHRTGTDLSMFDELNGTYLPRSNFYHTQLLAQNFRQNYLNHSRSPDGIVVIPMGDKDGLSIMVLNTGDKEIDYVLNFGKSNLKNNTNNISVDAHINKIYQSKINSETTQMLVFNNKGEVIKKYSYSKKEAELMKPPIIEK